MSAHITSNNRTANTKIKNITDKKTEEVSVCPIMKKYKYSKSDLLLCEHPKLKKYIPVGAKCCSSESDRCLLADIPWNNSSNNLLREVIFAQYQRKVIDESLIRKQIISFFIGINRKKGSKTC